MHVTEAKSYIDGTLFTLEPDDDSDIQGGCYLALSLSPGSSRATRGVFTVARKTGDIINPYETVETVEVHGGDETALIPISNPATEVLKAEVIVSGNTRFEKTFSLSDDHLGTEEDPHVHELKLVPQTVEYPKSY